MKYFILIFITVTTIFAEEWPTYQHDFHRSGVTSAASPARLQIKWQWKSPQRPQTAWSAPAKWDAFSGNDGLQSLRNFDPAFFVTGKDDKVYFGSSVDNAVHCLNLKSGKEEWLFFTNGPVRFPPTIYKGKLYFGSDDGFIYCINTLGKEVWKYQAVKNGRQIPSNGKIISMWPCRTGVIIDNDKVYFANSLVPWETSYVCAVDAQSGKEIFKKEHQNITLEGAILAASGQLIIPQGRASALTFNQQNGNKNGALGNAGSTFLLVTEDDRLVSGPSNQKNGNNVVHVSNPKTRTNMITLDGTDRMIIDGGKAYYHKNGQLVCIDRINYTDKTYKRNTLLGEKNSLTKQLKKKASPQKSERIKAIEKEVSILNKALDKTTLWKIEAPLPVSWIKAGKHLISGQDGNVSIIDANNGKTISNSKIIGRAYGLAVWNQTLLVSTDAGYIYCFGQ